MISIITLLIVGRILLYFCEDGKSLKQILLFYFVSILGVVLISAIMSLFMYFIAIDLYTPQKVISSVIVSTSWAIIAYPLVAYWGFRKSKKKKA